jgi:hypothetical protein
MTFDPSKWFPGCPHVDADPANGEVYRIVKSDPPSASDFLTHAEMNKLRKADACDSASRAQLFTIIP